MTIKIIAKKSNEDLMTQALGILNGRVKLSPREYVLARNNCFTSGKLRVLQSKCKNKQIYHTSEGGRYFFYLTDVLLNLQKGL